VVRIERRFVLARSAKLSAEFCPRLIVCTGFFLAAMIPVRDGYRGSLMFSTTPMTADSVPSTTW
jgi:hypothetical protein